MVKISLYGKLDVYGEDLEVSADTPREAMSAVIAHLKRTNPELFKTTLFFQIKDYNCPDALDVPLEVGAHLHLMPAFVVGKKTGIFQIVIGAVLVIGGLYLGLPTAFATGLKLMGVSLAIGGTLQLLAPVPQIDTQPEDTNPEASKYISGTGNTTKIGTRIPQAYGTFPVYGHFLSINVDTKDISTGPYGGNPVLPTDPDYTTGYGVGDSIHAF